ncbi:hypothetical protein LMG7141_04127 [Ralstonia condita]|uniref:Uncharacterized protein n=1 Tax=Ralstonia condita TaxID=3058600 RepID=A0ABN9JBC9_9RALS|nr:MULTISPECIES: hypothetical protein [Ralstonia]CAJ0802564.1 hypothetical protein LMG7141_04127 [Ralstonia sp. LMG 7141]
MANILRIAVGETVSEFEDGESLEAAWKILNARLAERDDEIAVVFENEHGYRVGEIWESSIYHALAETPGKLRAYLALCGFFEDPPGE